MLLDLLISFITLSVEHLQFLVSTVNDLLLTLFMPLVLHTRCCLTHWVLQAVFFTRDSSIYSTVSAVSVPETEFRLGSVTHSEITMVASVLVIINALDFLEDRSNSLKQCREIIPSSLSNPAYYVTADPPTWMSSTRSGMLFNSGVMCRWAVNEGFPSWACILQMNTF